ncbi:MAG: murein transglycosylase A [Hyphomicrobiaceae bacterium]
MTNDSGSPKTQDTGGATPQQTPGVRFEPVPFDALPGWAHDDHAAALIVFDRSCARVVKAMRVGAKMGDVVPPPAFPDACAAAADLVAKRAGTEEARAFFERHFHPHRVVHDAAEGLFTGYFEPVVKGALQKSDAFNAPLMRRPADLVNLVSEAERGAKADGLTHARQTAAGPEPYPTRRQIDEGALAPLGLEFVYLQDPVEVFFMQVQGSGLVELPDGSHLRVAYDGKNGHAYTSIGRYLIEKGIVPAERMSLDALKQWLRANPQQMRDVLWQNASYVFFRPLAGEEASDPLGVLGIPLTPGRSLAVDTRFHAIGTPVYVSAAALKHSDAGKDGFHRLMIAQDVGSAIRGPERGDIYFGSGDAAGRVAGVTKHAGNFFVLLPRAAPRESIIEAARAGAWKKIRQARQ